MNTETKKPNIFKMINEPKKQLQLIKERPTIVMPLIIVSLLMAIGLFLVGYNTDLGPEFAELDEALGDGQNFQLMTSAISALGGLISPAFIALFTSVIYLIIAKILQSNVSFKQLYAMNLHILIVSVLSVILTGLIGFIIPITDGALFTSLGSVISTENIYVSTILMQLEVFAIWLLILKVIGLQIVADFSKNQARTLVIVLFIFSILTSLSVLLISQGNF